MAPITVAVLGPTGLLGGNIINGLLEPQFYPSEIGRVVGLVRDVNSDKSKALSQKGVELVLAQPTIETFKGVDVFVNAASSHNPADWPKWDEYTKAAIDAGIKVFFPGDFGSDHWRHNVDFPLWNAKKAQAKYAEEYGAGRVKVVSVSNGGFFPFGNIHFAKLLGLDHLGGHYEVVGDPKARFSFTHLGDIGRSVARLSLLAINEPDSVPSVVRVSGDAKNSYEIAELVSKSTGKPITVTAVDIASLGTPGPGDFVKVLRIFWGQGYGDHSDIKNNELVNPGEKYWKWSTLEGFVNERPGNYPLGSLE